MKVVHAQGSKGLFTEDNIKYSKSKQTRPNE